MFNSLKNIKINHISVKNPEIKKLADLFKTVKSIEDCHRLLYQQGLLSPLGIDKVIFSELSDVCSCLRDQGLGLEPNLLGRAIASLIIDPIFTGEVSIYFASKDTDVQEKLREAEKAISCGDYSDSEYRYWLVLQYFPSHPSYLVQYAHSLKEENKFQDALVQYLDASFFGAPKQDIYQHILYVAERINKYDEIFKILKRRYGREIYDQLTQMDWELTVKDVLVITKLLHNRLPSLDEVLLRMTNCTNRRELIVILMHEKEFNIVHRDLLRMISEIEMKKK